jgi:hypothetical protein
MGGACGTYGEEEGAYRVLVGRLEGRRQLERNFTERGHWKDLGVDGRTVLE